MNTVIHLRTRKEVTPTVHNKILRLKGSLIAKSFTDIVHIEDDGDEYHVHYFTIQAAQKEAVLSHLSGLIEALDLKDAISITYQ